MRLLLIVPFLSLLMVFTVDSIAQDACDYKPIIKENFEFKSIVFGNVISVVEDNQSVLEKETIGTIAPYPETFTESFDQQLNISKSLYAQGHFLIAYQTLEKARSSEPNNPFILNESARAAYMVDSLKTTSLKLYKELITILDEEGAEETDGESIYINIWFTEAYWKIGTLYMDVDNFSDATYEIQRALVSLYNRGSPQIFEQIYSFLAKSYYKLDKDYEAQCFAKEALRINPDNEFVKPYMQE